MNKHQIDSCLRFISNLDPDAGHMIKGQTIQAIGAVLMSEDETCKRFASLISEAAKKVTGGDQLLGESRSKPLFKRHDAPTQNQEPGLEPEQRQEPATPFISQITDVADDLMV